MCSGGVCSHCDQEVHKRERTAKRIIELIMTLSKDMDNEEFVSVRLEMIGLVNELA